MKISIILTVYNKEAFLQRAFNAILNQQNVDVDDYELLVVNDGSTDGSADILEQYSQQDSRVRILTQSNQGLSMARNNGFEDARGEYVWFVDADDAISKESVSMLVKAMDLKPDVIPIYAVTDGIDRVRNKINPELLTGKEILLKGNWEHCGVFWVYKKSFLINNKLRFFPGIYHEDAEFTPRMLYLAQTIKVVPEILYRVYRGDENSITEIPRPKRAYDMVTVVERLMDFFDSHGERQTLIGRVMNKNNAGILNTALYVISSNNKEEWSKFDKYLYDRRCVLNSFYNSTVFKYRVEGCLFCMFPKHYTKVFRLIRTTIEKK